jgi:hypothetical protein
VIEKIEKRGFTYRVDDSEDAGDIEHQCGGRTVDQKIIPFDDCAKNFRYLLLLTRSISFGAVMLVSSPGGLHLATPKI